MTNKVLWTNGVTKDAPFLSLCIICGDAGVTTLHRLLRSVLERRSALVDEVHIFFNGKAPVSFESRLRTLTPSVPITIYAQEWAGRFDTARAESFEPARGEWILWLDTDDLVADPDQPADLKAISDVFRDYNQQKPNAATEASKVLTLRDWLRTLPASVNTVLAPYNYTEDEQGNCLVRQIFKRIVRRDQFQWHSADGLHEQLVAKTVENAVTNLGFLVRHRPSEDASIRVKRNHEVIKHIAGETPKDARHAYDIAGLYITNGEWAKADELLRVAISSAQNILDSYRFRLTRAQVASKRNASMEALQEIVAAVTMLPDHPEAYWLATEAFVSTGQWRSAVTFYEIGRTKTATPGPFDQPVMSFIQPRVQAAIAYGQLGEPAKGALLLAEVEARYADSPLLKDALAQLQQASAKKRAVDGLVALAEYVKEDSELAALLKSVQRKSVLLRGVDALPAFRDAVCMADEESCTVRKAEVPATFPARSPWSDDAPPSWVVEVDFKGPADTQRIVDELGEYGEVVELTPRKFHVSKLTPPGALVRRIAFYAPVSMDPYDAKDIDTRGLGGSEGSVIYLARELARLGHAVDVYLPARHPVAQCWDGVTYLPLTHWSPKEPYDLIVACRAPWLVREKQGGPVVAWHQDNGYANPWMWGQEVYDKLYGNFFVSAWARTSLYADGNITRGKLVFDRHPRDIVLGNGLCRADFKWPEMGATREPRRVIYASDPSRGLKELLDVWPDVRASFPDAELVIACGFRVSLTLAQSQPGIPQLAELNALAAQLATMTSDPAMNVKALGWVTHPRLRELFAASGIYAYPGGPMPEGYGVALMQAAAAGCDMVFPAVGALPEVLGGGIDPGIFKEILMERVEAAPGIIDAQRRGYSMRLIDHRWDNVAARFVKYMEAL